jgi:hypothetical protein
VPSRSSWARTTGKRVGLDISPRMPAVAGDVEDNFLEFGRALRQLLERDRAFEKAVVQNCGSRLGRGLINKEPAVMTLIKAALSK